MKGQGLHRETLSPHLLDALLQHLLVRVRQRALAQVAVVVEALLERGADGQLRAKTGLQRLAQHVRAAVPEGLHVHARPEC